MPDIHLDNVREYFIGANTCSGFIFCAEEDFKAPERVYIIKGGPGTGKSTLLKSVAAEAKRRGEAVTVYRCSSDPDSLDGVILNSRSIGLVDGTAPHVYEGKCPGATEIILDTGAFWCQRLLSVKKDEINALGGMKKRLFSSAYRLLAAASTVADEEEIISEGFFLKDKARAAIGRILQGCRGGSGFTVKPKQTVAFSTVGVKHLSTFSEIARLSYTVSDAHGIAPLLMKTVLEEARRRELEAQVSCDQYGRPLEIYLTEADVAFVTEGGQKILNCQRFCDNDGYRRVKQRLRLHEGLRLSLDKAANEELSEARAPHFALEDIYKETMDLPSLTLMTEAFVKELFN